MWRASASCIMTSYVLSCILFNYVASYYLLLQALGWCSGEDYSLWRLGWSLTTCIMPAV